MKTKIDIARWRKKHELSQADLADLLPISKRTLQKWEQGAGEPPAYFSRALRDLSRELEGAKIK